MPSKNAHFSHFFQKNEQNVIFGQKCKKWCFLPKMPKQGANVSKWLFLVPIRAHQRIGHFFLKMPAPQARFSKPRECRAEWFQSLMSGEISGWKLLQGPFQIPGEVRRSAHFRTISGPKPLALFSTNSRFEAHYRLRIALQSGSISLTKTCYFPWCHGYGPPATELQPKTRFAAEPWTLPGEIFKASWVSSWVVSKPHECRDKWLGSFSKVHSKSLARLGLLRALSAPFWKNEKMRFSRLFRSEKFRNFAPPVRMALKSLTFFAGRHVLKFSFLKKLKFLEKNVPF